MNMKRLLTILSMILTISSLFATILGTCVGDSFYKVKWKDALQFTSQDIFNLKLNL